MSEVSVAGREPVLVDAMRSPGLLDWLSFRELLRNLVLRDLRLKYRGSVLGFLWSMVNPLVTIGIYAVAFGYILKVPTQSFVLYLISGLLAWGYFAVSLSMSTGAVIDSGSLVKAVYFPRSILPMATVLFNLTQFLLTCAIALPAALLIYRIPPTVSMLAWPIFVILQTMLCIGLALLLATLTAFFRDIRHFLEIALQVLFWLTPLVYEQRMVPSGIKFVSMLSPMTPIVMGYHQSLYYRVWPEPFIFFSAALYACAALSLGIFVFRRYEARFGELL
jgi:lipopolysaccharide transport system permease protein